MSSPSDPLPAPSPTRPDATTGAGHDLVRLGQPALLDDLFRLHWRGPRPDLAIHRDDEMLAHALAAQRGDFDAAVVDYFVSGMRLITTLGEIVDWRFGGFAGVGRTLDFASGYGRVTRYLARLLPPERLWVADILPRAMSFQAARFGVHPLLAPSDPAALECAERFDCIVVTSLFTHLPEATFRRWLERLSQLLAPGGCLVLSVHDAALLRGVAVNTAGGFVDPLGDGGSPHDEDEVSREARVPPSGLFFVPTSESRSLAAESYGSTWVERRYVEQAVASLGPGFTLAHLPRAFCNLQDVYVVVNDPAADVASLRVRAEPEAMLDSCRLDPDGWLRVTGWAACPTPVTSVEIFLDGERVEHRLGLLPRPDVARHRGVPADTPLGWDLARSLGPVDAATASRRLLVRLTTGEGRESLAFAGTVATALGTGWRAGRSHGAGLVHELRTSRAEVAALKRVLAESRWWRLGRAGYRCGRRVLAALGVRRRAPATCQAPGDPPQ